MKELILKALKIIGLIAFLMALIGLFQEVKKMNDKKNCQRNNRIISKVTLITFEREAQRCSNKETAANWREKAEASGTAAFEMKRNMKYD